MDKHVQTAARVHLPMRMVGHLRNRMAAGLVLLLPIAITYLILRTVVGFLDDLIRPSTKTLEGWFPGAGWVDLVPPVGSVVVVIFLLYFSGLTAQNFIGRRLVHLGHTLVDRIPVVRAIYSTAREATNLFSGANGTGFSRVVLVSFPHPGARSLAFVTGTFRAPEGEYLMVYVPTTPTPMSGFLVFVRETEVEDAGISVDAAMRMVITGGISTNSRSDMGASPLQGAPPTSQPT